MPRTKTSWRPGQSGNPGGRPPRVKAFADLLRAALSKRLPDGKTARETLAQQLVKLAVSGREWSAARRWAVEVLLDRTEGKPVSVIDARIDRDANQRAARQAIWSETFRNDPEAFESAMLLAEKYVEADARLSGGNGQATA